MKKILARVLVVVALCSALSPAVALVPLVAAGMAGAAAAPSSFTMFTVYSAWIVGGALAWVGLARDPTAPTSELPPLIVQINSSEPLPTPTGWTAPVSPSVEPQAPNTATYIPPAGATSWPGGNIADCALHGVSAGGTGTGPVYYANNYQNKCIKPDGSADATAAVSAGWSAQGGSTWNGWRMYYKALAQCGTGYTYSAPNCVATVGAVPKPSDGKCTITRSGNTFSNDALDPDCVSMPVDVTVTGTVITAKPSTTETQKVTINGDGSTSVTNSTYNTSNNTTTTTTINVSPGSTPGQTKITGVGTTTLTGQGDAVGSTPIPPTNYPQPCGIPGQPACKIDETGTPTAGDMSGATAALDSAAAARQAQIEGVGGAGRVTSLGAGWGFSGLLPSCSCSPLALSIKGWSGGHDWCPLFAQSRTLLGWFYALLGALYVWRRATSFSGGK